MPLTFTKVCIDAAKADARAKYPLESCGIIVNDNYIPCKNIADIPEKDFEINPAEYQNYMMNKTLQAIVHSHPVEKHIEKSSPSAADMKSQIAMGIPYGIIDIAADGIIDPYWWGDFLLDEPLIGTEFHHGINDCYTTVRKWFWQKKGIKLVDIPRGNFWWLEKDTNLYFNGFEKAGFIKVTKSELQDGDCMLGKVKSTQINHSGVYLHNKVDGLGVVLHHLPGRLARRESASPYVSKAELFLRYVGHDA